MNATDLFVQIVYRGPMGDTGAMEPDAIAMGTLDVREPLFAAYWNNTDYFWNGSAWVAHNAVNRDQGIQSFWVCAGGAPVKMIFEYNGAVGSPAMIDPVVNANVPGMARLGVVVPPPDFPGQAKSLRGCRPIIQATHSLRSIPVQQLACSNKATSRIYPQRR